jgi:ABC-2 type transport system permease protein
MRDGTSAPSPSTSTIIALLDDALSVALPPEPVMRRDAAIALHVARHELRANLRTALAWLVPLVGILVLVCMLQPTFAAGPLAAKIESLPRAMRDALGLAVVDFHRPAAYLATNLTYVTLGTAMFGALLGARIVAKEEVLHTAELLYTRPARRGAILAGKAIALAVYTLALPCLLGALAMTMLAIIVPAPLEPGLVASLFVGCACAAVLFAGLGLLVATLWRARTAPSLAIGIVLATFAVGLLSSAVPSMHGLRWISPLKLVEANGIVAGGGIDPRIALALVGAGVACAVAGIVRYRRRDIHA